MTAASDGPLDRWQKRFETRDKCPWPGPRPLGGDDVLIGRDSTRNKFLRELRGHRLILLHGASGVGKTSLLRAGLLPDLHGEGYEVYRADQWGGMRRNDLTQSLAVKLRLPSTGSDPFAALDETTGGRAVLILDQFEELIRYSPLTTTQVFDLILDLNADFEFKIIIAFRSEYLHEFKYLTDEAVNFSFAEFRLEEVVDDVAPAIIGAAGPKWIDDSAVQLIADRWVAARRAAREANSPDDPFDRIGLLHLQAFLYAVHFTTGRARLTAESIVGHLTDVWWSDGRPDGATGESLLDGRTFRMALQKSVEVKLAHCEEASDGPDENPIDAGLQAGARSALARAVPHLSSAGYKLIREAQELARNTLGTDFVALTDGLSEAPHKAVGAKQMQALFDVVLASAAVGEEAGEGRPLGSSDLLSTRRADFAAAADELSVGVHETDTWGARIDRHGTTFENDALEVTSGLMMGLSPADVLIEEFRRFAFALVWLETSALIRVTTPQGGTTMISLIHDGFGPALIRWSRNQVDDASGPLHAVTAPRGAAFVWDRGVSGRDLPDGHRLVLNMRWKGASAIADLEDVVFVNCDMRGAIFLKSRLAGVTFVNCMLDGTIFSDCSFIGTQEPVPEGDMWNDLEPVFTIGGHPLLVRDLVAYRGAVGVSQDTLFSNLPGAPAVPLPTGWHNVDGGANLEEVWDATSTLRFQKGGVTVYGGRISGLVLRNCYFDDQGGLSLRHTTGSGLEIVEVTDSPGQVEIFGSALRQISITANQESPDDDEINVTARKSVLAQMWLGPGLKGTVQVSDCRVIQAWNGSNVEFSIRESTVHDVIDIEVEESTHIPKGTHPLRAEDLTIPDEIAVADQLHRMDYRRNPSKLRESLGASGPNPRRGPIVPTDR